MRTLSQKMACSYEDLLSTISITKTDYNVKLTDNKANAAPSAMPEATYAYMSRLIIGDTANSREKGSCQIGEVYQ
jgi:hypothetical protein